MAFGTGEPTVLEARLLHSELVSCSFPRLESGNLELALPGPTLPQHRCEENVRHAGSTQAWRLKEAYIWCHSELMIAHCPALSWEILTYFLRFAPIDFKAAAAHDQGARPAISLPAPGCQA